MGSNKLLESTKKSLERVQNFESNNLKRAADLGESFHFGDAIEPAQRVVGLFRQLPLSALDDLPDTKLKQVGERADAFFALLQQMLEFDPATQENPINARNQLISNIKAQHEQNFSQLHQLIAYGASRQRDIDALEHKFLAAIQRAEDRARGVMDALEEDQSEAERILGEVREVAAERGVSQQAVYFAKESTHHDQQSDKWRFWTIVTAIVLVVFAVASVFAHKHPYVAPTNTYEAIQLGLSKALIFAALGYMLFLCARNFLSHKHNAIVNKHRQNALLTFNALVDAAKSEDRRDVVLTYAASCIFSPQDTGYAKSSGGVSAEAPLNLIQAMPRLEQSAQQ